MSGGQFWFMVLVFVVSNTVSYRKGVLAGYKRGYARAKRIFHIGKF